MTIFCFPPQTPIKEKETKDLLLLLAKLLDGLLDNVDHLAQSDKQRAKAKAPTPDAHGVDEEVDERPIAAHKAQEDAKVAPLVGGRDVERAQVSVGVLVWAVLAGRRGVGVEEVSACRRCKGAGVGLAGLACGDVEHGGFFGGAFDADAVEGCGEDTADPVGRWVYVVPKLC